MTMFWVGIARLFLQFIVLTLFFSVFGRNYTTFSTLEWIIFGLAVVLYCFTAAWIFLGVAGFYAAKADAKRRVKERGKA